MAPYVTIARRLVLLGGWLFTLVSYAIADVPDRSPVDLAVTSDERWLVTANETSDSVSLVDLKVGRIVQEIPCGHRPAAIAISVDDRKVLVTGTWSGDLTIFDLAGGQLKPSGKVQLGFEPRDVAITRDGRIAYVALTAADTVAIVDLAEKKLLDQIEVARWPRYLALSADDRKLAVGTSGDLSVCVVDTAARKVLFEESTGGINLGHMQVSADGKYVYLPWMVYRQNPINAANIRKGWVLGSRIGRIKLDGPSRREAITLDPPGIAVSDPHGLSLTEDGNWIVATGSGTHELLVYDRRGLEFQSIGPGDHIDPRLLGDRKRFFRIPLDGRPMAVRTTRDSRRAIVANYLTNSIQIVDLAQREVIQTIDLGGAAQPSLARQGAAVFYDGRRSLDQWYSCHSCHYDGGAAPVAMDTKNDRTERTFKTVHSLVNVAHTAPWTWHGWQKDLQGAMRTSMTETMLGPIPSYDDVRGLVAFLESLDNPPNPYRRADGALSEAAERGKVVFQGQKAACASCHRPPYFTDGEIHDVGLGSSSDVYQGYNTPSLIGLHRRVRFLHDGRSRSLDDLLTGPHNPAKVAGEGELTENERRDLIEYLKSL
jgi:DNA-binding beta-propeller fold protein YncE/mono/diheme cytochrome c family protein